MIMKDVTLKVLFIFISFSILNLKAQKINILDSLGRKQGQWLDYYDKENSKIKSRRNYHNNELDGKTYIFTKKGVLKEIYFYSEGKFIFSKSYKTKGKKAGEAYKIHGLKIDKTKSKYFFERNLSDTINDSINYTDSHGKKQGLWHEIFIGSLLSPTTDEYYCVGVYKNGMRQGLWKFYLYEGRQLEYSILFKEDKLDGRCEIYYLSGITATIYEFKNSKMDGSYFSYFKNGKVREKGKMKNDNFYGEYFRYNSRGKLVRYIKNAEIESPLENW